ncbi:hypothetical protein FRX31_007933 [Thalictrum thalictroides]|uniref:Uncharacterized protein n=1 Tax=Thalictrum thalictroides TaxID=46969 RepID=A0A7J6X0X4_THATH|nr:hypothetical protein FRX31_007933 [Thalictrum thalictroides]
MALQVWSVITRADSSIYPTLFSVVCLEEMAHSMAEKVRPKVRTTVMEVIACCSGVDAVEE